MNGLWFGRRSVGSAVAMIYPGLVSITFRKLSPSEVVALVRKAGFSGIEWGGDIHVPHGDLVKAREVRELTEQAGLKVAAYGSYYRVGRSEAEGLPFDRVLETAVELGAPTIRVWAGTTGSSSTDEDGRWKIVRELRRLGDLASKKLVSVSLEFHGGTLTDTNESASQLLVEVDHANVFMLWQPHVGEGMKECLEGLRAVRPRMGNVHVFHWWPTATDRLPLAEGVERWKGFLTEIEEAPGDRFALMEFVQGDDPATFLRDAAVLKNWLEGRW